MSDTRPADPWAEAGEIPAFLRRADAGQRDPGDSLEGARTYQVMPPLSDAEYHELKADIAARGVMVPLEYDESGNVLDGHHRERACKELGITDWPRIVRYGLDDAGKRLHARQLNLARRHLNQEAKRRLIEDQLRETPECSNRTIAASLGVDDTTVGDARRRLEATAGIPQLERTVGADGKYRPTSSRYLDGSAVVQAGELSESGAEESIRRGLTTGVAMCPYAERGHDLYETPPGAVHALLAEEALQGSIWEPASGRGAIARVLRAQGHRVVATDLIDYGCPDATGGVDFLQQCSAPDGVTTILTNPPFSHAPEFVRRALTLAPRVIMLLRLLFLETQNRRDILEGGRLARVYVFRNRIQIHRDGWPEEERDSNPMALAWYVWERQHCGSPELRWLSCDESGATA
jgi:hypothetical protein